MPPVKPRLLFVTHCYNNRGGVEEHLKTLAGRVGAYFEPWVTYPEEGLVRLRSPDGSVSSLPGQTIGVVAPLRCTVIENSLSTIIKRVRPDLIHLMHFINWPLGVIAQLAATGKLTLMSFHDYYAITPHFTMQGTEDPQDTLTPTYASAIFGQDISLYLAQRRRYLQSILQTIPRRVVPSDYLRRSLAAVFPPAFEIIEYGIEPFTVSARKTAPAELRFGYLGSLIPQKGWQSLIEAFSIVRAHFPHISLHIFGGRPTTPPATVGVEYHGPYGPADLPTITAQFDIGIIPSLFAETYSLVLSELRQAGLPTAVSDIGALGERVIEGVNGRKFTPGCVSSIADTLTCFAEDNSWREWEIPQPRLADKMTSEYLHIYKSALSLKGAQWANIP